jgi:hypothetical protein
VSEPPVASTEESPPSRWTGLGPALARFALACAGIAVVLGGLVAAIAFATGHQVSGAVAIAYYIVGCILFLIGTFPSGGFSLVRGTMTRRHPIGARQEPIFIFGLVLIGLGVVADLYL